LKVGTVVVVVVVVVIEEEEEEKEEEGSCLQAKPWPTSLLLSYYRMTSSLLPY